MKTTFLMMYLKRFVLVSIMNLEKVACSHLHCHLLQCTFDQVQTMVKQSFVTQIVWLGNNIETPDHSHPERKESMTSN